MKIIIMHETVASHDAVGNDIEAMYQILKENHECYVYALTRKNPNVSYIEWEDFEQELSNPDLIVIYHHSVHWEEGFEILKRVKGKIIFRYHNITPEGFFKNYNLFHYEVSRKGRVQTKIFQREFPNALWLADSEYNTRDLYMVPREHIAVCPPFHKLEQWGQQEADQDILRKIRESDTLNLLFVGRVVPNKGHLDLLDILWHYVSRYDKKIKLRIIGKFDAGIERYNWLVKKRTEDYGLQDQVEFIGEINDNNLISYYKGSDILLCASAHEGFCVPVVEAQYFGLPVVALRYGAVPETLGPNQITLGYDADKFAAALRIIHTNSDYKSYLSKIGKENYDRRFSYYQIKQTFTEYIDQVITDHECEEQDNIQQLSIKKVAVVIPWFNDNISGGAEMAARDIAYHLADAGVDVEVLTTCVEKFASDWSVNYYPEGTEYINGIPVTRFVVDERNAAAFDQVNLKLMNGEKISEVEEYIFCKEMVNSVPLYNYIKEHKAYYDAFLFIPYMFGTTYYGIQECREKAIMIPCLHDESYAYMECFKREFSKVAGMIFLSEPEQQLAERLFDTDQVKKMVAGTGVDTDISYSSIRFRQKYQIEDDYIIYAGRKDPGKGVDILIDYFCAYKKNKNSDLKLVLIGGGSIQIPQDFAQDIVDLGFVDLQDKYDALNGAICLCQLSKFESFSLVLMESWTCERPVIVNQACQVTTNFAKSFEGGYAVGSYSDFEQALDTYINNPEQSKQMGINGRRRVKQEFSWDAIVRKYSDFIDTIIKGNQAQTRQNNGFDLTILRKQMSEEIGKTGANAE